MGQQLTGVHVFEKLGPIEWEDELIAIQAISALSWKKFHGRIELYCNEEHLESLKKWGVDKIYDKIDIDLLKKSPKNINRNEFWTFCKLFVSSNLEPPFVLVDTDLWITSPLEFDLSNSFVAYHEESYDWSRPNNFYVDFDEFIPEKYLGYFDKGIKPTNVALLLWNDKDLLNDWYKIAKETLSDNRNCGLNKNQKTIFLEQWLLPMNAVKTNKKYTTLIPQIYMNCNELEDFTDADNMWSPPVNLWTEDEWSIFNKIKHVWGLKKRFDEQNVVEQVFEKVKKILLELEFDNKKIIKFVEKKSGVISGYERKKKNSINILYCIPNIITDSQSNFLYKRIQEIYNNNDNIVIHVCILGKYNHSNISLKNKVIEFIGTNNFISSENNLNSLKKIIEVKKINIVQYDLSFYDNDFNNIMNELFDEKIIPTIKSTDGENLYSNNGKNISINLQIQNKILDLLPDVGYEFDKFLLPIHVVYENRIKFRLDFQKKHIIILGDFKSSELQDYITQIVKNFFHNNSKIEFHFLTYMDVERDLEYINLLTPNCKIWIENLNFYEFIKVSDLVIDLTKTPNSLVNEVISYGIPILKSNINYNYENFTYDFTFDLEKDCNMIEKIAGNKLSKKIPLLSTNFTNKYCNFYSLISNK